MAYLKCGTLKYGVFKRVRCIMQPGQLQQLHITILTLIHNRTLCQWNLGMRYNQNKENVPLVALNIESEPRKWHHTS
jgi:hypothetical protein